MQILIYTVRFCDGAPLWRYSSNGRTTDCGSVGTSSTLVYLPNKYHIYSMGYGVKEKGAMGYVIAGIFIGICIAKWKYYDDFDHRKK